MKSALATEHKEFFSKNHYIEFEGLLSLEEIDFLPKAQGRDFWRKDPLIKKMVHRRDLAEIAAALLNQKQIRLAFDQMGALDQPLEQMSCLKPLCMGLILKHDGSGTFFDPHFCIPQSESQFFIAYAKNKLQYLLEKNDPYTHLFKKMGFAFGDMIQNPIVYKS